MKGSKCRRNVQITFGIGNRVGKSVYRLCFICLFFYDAQSLFVWVYLDNSGRVVGGDRNVTKGREGRWRQSVLTWLLFHFPAPKVSKRSGVLNDSKWLNSNQFLTGWDHFFHRSLPCDGKKRLTATQTGLTFRPIACFVFRDSTRLLLWLTLTHCSLHIFPSLTAASLSQRVHLRPKPVTQTPKSFISQTFLYEIYQILNVELK